MDRRNFLSGASVAVALMLAKVGIARAAADVPEEEMDAGRWSTFGEHETQILLLEKELREMGDVRDIASVEVRKNESRYFIKFFVAFDAIPEGWRDVNLYVDDEGYNRVQAFKRDGHWHWCIRRMTILDIVDFDTLQAGTLQGKSLAEIEATE